MTTATRAIRSSGSEGSAVSAKRLTLADTVRGGRNLPSRVIFHGQGGIGKTSFAAHAPKPYFLLSRGETGLHTLIDSGQLPPIPNIEAEDWPTYMGIISELTTADHDHKTLVVDVLDGAEKLANERVCAESFSNDWGKAGFEGYQAGYKSVANTVWREMLVALDKLRSTRNMGIICLAHTGVSNFANPRGSDYNRYVPDMYKSAWQLAYGWADIVLFGYHEIIAAKDKTDRKAKGHGGSVRLMQTVYDATADAKNRHGLPDEIPMGSSGEEAWQNFKAALVAGRNGKAGE